MGRIIGGGISDESILQITVRDNILIDIENYLKRQVYWWSAIQQAYFLNNKEEGSLLIDIDNTPGKDGYIVGVLPDKSVFPNGEG